MTVGGGWAVGEVRDDDEKVQTSSYRRSERRDVVDNSLAAVNTAVCCVGRW